MTQLTAGQNIALKTLQKVKEELGLYQKITPDQKRMKYLCAEIQYAMQKIQE